MPVAPPLLIQVTPFVNQLEDFLQSMVRQVVVHPGSVPRSSDTELAAIALPTRIDGARLHP